MSRSKVSGFIGAGSVVGAIGALGLSACLFVGVAAWGQSLSVPEAVVVASRLGDGIAGASVTIITGEQLRAAPHRTIPDVLALEAGIQTRDLFGATAGAKQSIDMRGFGATGTQNVLVLLNGRRLNDIDNGPVDWASIQLATIERIEIIRGNAGAVLYGDGAMGGVVNIVTRAPAANSRRARVGVAAGSNEYYEASAFGEYGHGPIAVRLDANQIESNGNRLNNDLKLRNFSLDATHRGEAGDAYLQLGLDDQRLGLPGGRLVDKNKGINLLATDPQGAATPRDFGEQSGIRSHAGFTRDLAPGLELAMDFGVRVKDMETTTDSAHVDTVLRTFSVTPRLVINRAILDRPANLTVGVDYYFSDYDQDRGDRPGLAPNTRYDAKQNSVAAYGQGAVAVTEDTDLTLGARSQWVGFDAGLLIDKAAPGGSFLNPVSALHLWDRETALSAGIERSIVQELAVFGRVGQSVRIPTVDERVSTVSGTFNLESQISKDAEVGFRVDVSPLNWQTSAYVMDIKHELHFNPEGLGCFGSSCFGANSNYDRTRRYGIENGATLQVTDAVTMRGSVAYTQAKFAKGPFEGNDVPLVSDWTASTGVVWQIVPELLRVAATASFVGARRMENDERNFQPKLGSTLVFDTGLSGTWRGLVWSAQVNNVFDEDVVAYAVASAATRSRYNAYPLPGREALLRLSWEF